MIHEDDLQEDLVKPLVKRLNDQGIPPETDQMRWMCAITLGRMKAESALPDLRKNATGGGLVGRPCYWAIEQITGEEPPPPRDYVEQPADDWFLAPIRDED